MKQANKRKIQKKNHNEQRYIRPMGIPSASDQTITPSPYHPATCYPPTTDITTHHTTNHVYSKGPKQPYLSSHTPSEEYAKMAMLGFAALTATFLAGASATNLPTYYSSVTAGQL